MKTGILGVSLLLSTAAFAAEAKVDKYYEYVETNNEQKKGVYVLLDYTPKSDSVIETTVEFLSVSWNAFIFCARGKSTDAKTFSLLNYGGSGLRWDYNRTTAKYWKVAANEKHDLKATNTGLFADGDETAKISATPAATPYTAGNKLVLFASYTAAEGATPAPNDNFAKIRLYSFKAYDLEDGELMLKVDLRPCIDTNGEVALHDAVSDHLYYAVAGSSGKTMSAGGEEVFYGGPDTLEICGDPENLGAVKPAYGLTNGLAVGASFTCSAPSVWMNAENTITATCDGYKVYVENSLYTEGKDNEFTYEHPDCRGGARLDWQWSIKYKVAPVVGGEGSVSVSGDGWFASGETATVTAEPAEGWSFVRWEGDVPEDQKFSETLQLPVEGRVPGLKALFGSPSFIWPTGGEDDSETIQTAIDNAPEGGTVTLGDGLFVLTNEILIAKEVTLRSEHGREFTQVYQKNGSSEAMFRAIHINHKDAVVEGLAISSYGATKFTGTYDCKGSGVFIDEQGGKLTSSIVSNCCAQTLGGLSVDSPDAVVSNCVVCGNVTVKPRNMNYTTTPSLQMSAGLVIHSVIANNTSKYGDGYNSCLGAGAYLTGGRLSYCVITNNKITIGCNQGSNGAGIYVKAAAVIDNCLIAWNDATKAGGGVYANAGSFTNCTIVGNASGTGAGGVHVASRTTFYGCIIQDNTNASGFSDIGGTTGVFVNSVTDGSVTFEDGLVPAFGTDAIDACPTADYAADMSGAIDLAGRPRLSGGAVDAGAFEYQYPDFIASVAFLSDSVLPPGDTFSFTGKVVCTDASLVRYGWSIDGEDAEWTANALYSVSDLPAGVHTLTLSTRYDGVDKGEAGMLEFLVTYPDVYVVDPKLHPGHVAVYPFNLEGGAATSLVEAVACARSGTTVHVGPGVHDIDVPLELIGAVKLVSTDGREVTVIRQVATGGTQNRCVHLNDEGALLDGFALTGGSGHLAGIAACIDSAGGIIRNCLATNNVTGSSGGALAVLSAVGVISNCVVRYNTAIAGNNDAAGPVGLRVSAGLVVDCDISCNTNAHGFAWGGNCGIGAYLAGGRLTRCTVCDNASTKSTNNGAGGYGAGVYIVDASAVVDNCLIARNYSVENRGAVAFNTSGKASGTVLNCTIVDNAAIGVFAGDNRLGNIVNTLIQGNVNKSSVPEECTLTSKLVYKTSLCPTALPDGYGNITASAVFKGEGDYHLDRESPGIRVGRVTGYEDYLVGGVDLDGNRRATSRGKTDVGCYQSNIGLMLLVK